jgi:uncharacterized protein (TIGR03437 family)
MWSSKWVGVLLAVGGIRSPILAQAPTVARLSPGVFARVYYKPSTADHSPVSHETVTIHVDGLKALILGGANPAKVLLPRESRPGRVSLVLTTPGGSSAPFPITLDSYSPGLYVCTASVIISWRTRRPIVPQDSPPEFQRTPWV